TRSWSERARGERRAVSTFPAGQPASQRPGIDRPTLAHWRPTIRLHCLTAARDLESHEYFERSQAVAACQTQRLRRGAWRADLEFEIAPACRLQWRGPTQDASSIR